MTAGSPDEAYAAAVELEDQGRLAEAAEILLDLTQRLLTLNIALRLGGVLLSLGRRDDAQRWAELAAGQRPDQPRARRFLGQVYDAQGRVDLAERELRAALDLDPGYTIAKLNLASLLLSVGRYDEGWPLLEARTIHRDVVPPVNVPFPEWRGEPLDRRSILVWYEQGFGDQIQTCRFVSQLKARGAGHVALGCRPPLTHLFSTLRDADEIIAVPQGGQVEIRPYDLWTRYFSLPHRLGTTLQTIPTAPYLSAPADRHVKWAGLSGVGLAWRASPTGFNGRNKSLPPEQARRLLDLGCVSLDPEDTGARDFADTAAMVEQLDLVISIDSAAAHLAGAMGKPVWTLLPYVNTDWRWLRGRSDSPWYPTMRLYRLASPDGWPLLVDQVTADLEKRLAPPPSAP